MIQINNILHRSWKNYIAKNLLFLLYTYESEEFLSMLEFRFHTYTKNLDMLTALSEITELCYKNVSLILAGLRTTKMQ